MVGRSGSTAGPRLDFRPALTSERLVPLWAEAAAHVEAVESSQADWRRWRTALTALVSALQEAEVLAAAVEPSLGRRDWATRTPGPPAPAPTATVRSPRVPKPAPDATR
jgi:hypothetical protein